MEQKTTWMRYLIIGIKLSIIIVVSGCRNEYTVTADFMYLNETPYNISYNWIHPFTKDTINVFALLPFENTKLGGFVDGADKNPKIETCCEGYLDGIQSANQILVIFDNQRCITYEEGEGPTTTNILNGYERRVVTERHFEFTYRFTQDQFDQAELCN